MTIMIFKTMIDSLHTRYSTVNANGCCTNCLTGHPPILAGSYVDVGSHSRNDLMNSS